MHPPVHVVSSPKKADYRRMYVTRRVCWNILNIRSTKNSGRIVSCTKYSRAAPHVSFRLCSGC